MAFRILAFDASCLRHICDILFLLLLTTSSLLLVPVPSVGVPFSHASVYLPHLDPTITNGSPTCTIIASNSNLTSIESGDLKSAFDECQQWYDNYVLDNQVGGSVLALGLVIDLSHNYLSHLPIDLFTYQPFQVFVNLSSNAFTDASTSNFFAKSDDPSASVFGFINTRVDPADNTSAGVMSLDLSYNNMTNLTSLKYAVLLEFTCHSCNLSTLPNVNNYFNTYHALTLPHNQIRTIPNRTFQALTVNSFALDLSFNEISSLSDGLMFWQTPLTKLKLRGNNISIIPPNLFNFLTNSPPLEVVDFSENRITSIPDGLFTLPFISYTTTVSFAGNQLVTIPNGTTLFGSHTIDKLDLSRNRITSLPGVYDFLTSAFNISFNRLSSVPPIQQAGGFGNNGFVFDASNNNLTNLDPMSLSGGFFSLLDLSNNPSLGQSVIGAFQNIDSFASLILRRINLTHIPKESFKGLSIGVLDLSYNDLRNGLVEYSFSGMDRARYPAIWQAESYSIILRNCNLRSSSLAPRVFHSTYIPGILMPLWPVDLDIGNDPPSSNSTPPLPYASVSTYLATNPNVFVDFPDSIFSSPPLSYHEAHFMPWFRITIGGFVSYRGTDNRGLFGNATVGGIVFQLAPRIAGVAFGLSSSTIPAYCPVEYLARALSVRKIVTTRNLTIQAYDQPTISETQGSSECTFPKCDGSNCVPYVANITLAIEPSLLQKPFMQWINAIQLTADDTHQLDPPPPVTVRNDDLSGFSVSSPNTTTIRFTSISFIPPQGNIWNRALNQTNWIDVTAMCQLTTSQIELPGLPSINNGDTGTVGGGNGGSSFSFPPPDGLLSCLPASSIVLKWSRMHRFTSQSLFGRPANLPPIASYELAIRELYRGDVPVPIDFFRPIQILSNGLDQPSSSIVINTGANDCSVSDCPQSNVWIASRCPSIRNQKCQPCEQGTSSQFVHSALGPLYYCQSCPLGSYCNSSVSLLPILCEKGTYQSSIAQSKCLTCPAGTYNPVTGSSSPAACVLCPPGSSNINTGSTSSDACELCAPGTASSGSGVAQCPRCLPGTYSNNTGQFECTPCPINTYLNQGGATSVTECVKCPPATPLSPLGSTSSFSCAASAPCDDGNYTQISDSGACQSLCPLGSYCRGGVIRPCPVGSFSNITGISSCTSCGAGRYSTVGGQSESDCHSCPYSTYSSADQSGSCTPCPAGFLSTVIGATSNTSCTLSTVKCDSASSITTDAHICPLGSVEPITLGALLTNGIGLISSFARTLTSTSTSSSASSSLRANSTFARSLATVNSIAGQSDTDRVLTAAEITQLYRSYPTLRDAPSLRIAAFGTDSYLSEREATEPPNDRNTLTGGENASSLTTNTLITLIVILLVVAFLPWPFYRFIHARLAFHIDQFGLAHSLRAGQIPMKQPTQFGSAVTWGFLWVSILVAILLATANNTVTTTALVPPSSIPYAGTAAGTFEITMRAYSSVASVKDFCSDSTHGVEAQHARLIMTATDGFTSSSFVNRTQPDSQACSIAADCVGCMVSSGDANSVQFSFPYDTQLIEWELWSAAAAPHSWSRRYGVISQLPNQLLDAVAELHFSVIEAYHTDHSQSGDGVTRTGYELNFLQYTSITPQSIDTYSPASSIQLTFVLTKSDIMFDSVASSKLSPLQIVVSILTAIVSLFSIFAIVFRKTEEINHKFKNSSGPIEQDEHGNIRVVDQKANPGAIEGTASTLQGTSLKQLDLSNLHESQSPNNLNSPSQQSQRLPRLGPPPPPLPPSAHPIVTVTTDTEMVAI